MVFTLSWVGFGSAQDMRDHWIFGPGNHVRFTPSGPEYLGQVPMWSLEGVSSIADSAGNLVAYAYPGAVFHAGFDTVVNGVLDWSCLLPGGRGSSMTQGSMFLPGEQGLWHLFTIRGDSTGCGRYLYHDSIRISPTTGLAELVSPARKPVLPIQISERLTAVRHGNGKDWWVITTNAVGVSRGLSDQLLVFHLSQDTFLLESTIEIEDTRIYGELIAAPNGSLLALANVQFTRDTIECSLTILDFDRCVGSATPLRLYDFNRGIYSVEFSKSGDYLYMSTQDNSTIDCGIFQLDVEDSLSIPQRVYDCRDYIGRVVGHMERGPDDKIYFALSNNNSDPLIGFLNVISFPDLEGTACNVIEGYLPIAPPSFYYLGLPNHPNYYLGPDPRCSRDTTTTDTTSAIAPVLQVLSWKVYPTVAEGTVTVETSSPGGDITVLDAMGRIVMRTGLRAGRARWSTTAWPAGMYRVLLHRDGRYLGARTVVRP
jgi:hypothetical protein